MTKIDYKSQNRQYQYMRMSVAKTISERYPDIDHVDVEVVLDFVFKLPMREILHVFSCMVCFGRLEILRDTNIKS